MIKCIYLQIFDVENDVTVVCLMFTYFSFKSFRPKRGTLPWWLAQVFRATHGLPPCDDESYDPYGPYGDLGDVETDEVLALDSLPPTKNAVSFPNVFGAQQLVEFAMKLPSCTVCAELSG